MTTRLQVSPTLLKWACSRARISHEEIEQAFSKFPDWIAEDSDKRIGPTMKQLESFAKRTQTPLGFLFLPEPPEEPVPLPDFRTVNDELPRRPSPDLLDTVHAMQRRQAWFREDLIDQGAARLAFVGSVQKSDDPEAIGAEMRRIVGLSDDWAASLKSWKEAVTDLRRKIEGLRVMAISNGVVGNNTRRVLDVHEFRGFALVDEYAPLIFVNGADAKSAQMFTMAHELAHIWLGEEALSGFAKLMPEGTEAGTDVERWCNVAAAEFLVPKEQLKNLWPTIRREKQPFRAAARFFKVSPIVAARRAVDLSLVGRDEFFDFYDNQVSTQKGGTAGGGDFYKNQNTRVGALFGDQVIRAAMEGRISFAEAYQLTGLGGGTFQKYATRMGYLL